MARLRDIVIIGGGQMGLSLGYYLRRTGMDFLILDAAGPAVPGDGHLAAQNQTRALSSHGGRRANRAPQE